MTLDPDADACMIAEEYYTAENDFATYCQLAWPLIESVPLEWNWHHDIFCNTCEAVLNFNLGLPGPKVQKVVVNVSFGSTKTSIFFKLFPTWVWTRFPSVRFLTISHSADRATDAAVDSREIIQSPWYQKGWGKKVKLTGDQNVKTRYQNTARGFRVSFGLRAKGTGEHGDINIFDDPHDVHEAMFSKKILEADVAAYKTKWTSRLNDPRRSCQIIVGQRAAPKDLCGYVRTKGGWKRVKIPCRYVRGKGHKADPRTKQGQLYWPERYSQAWYDDQVKDLGPYGVAAQLQQDPKDLKGGLLNPDWFRRFDKAPDRDQFDELIVFWDTAEKGVELVNNPWAGILVGRMGKKKYILEVHRDWYNYPDGKKAVKDLALRWKPHTVVIEDKSTGQSLLAELPRESGWRWPLYPFQPVKDKVTRFGVEAGTVRQGQWYVPEKATWLETFLEELGAVPAADYMDQADAWSMASRHIRNLENRLPDDDLTKNTEGWPEEDIFEDWQE